MDPPPPSCYFGWRCTWYSNATVSNFAIITRMCCVVIERPWQMQHVPQTGVIVTLVRDRALLTCILLYFNWNSNSIILFLENKRYHYNICTKFDASCKVKNPVPVLKHITWVDVLREQKENCQNQPEFCHLWPRVKVGFLGRSTKFKFEGCFYIFVSLRQLHRYINCRKMISLNPFFKIS